MSRHFASLLLPPFAAVLAACNSPQEAAMRSPASPVAVAIAATSAPGVRADSPAEALGRRILSTAFVRVGPDGLLTVDRRDGRALLLRNLVMRRRDYCGTLLRGGRATQYCGAYSEVAAARPGDVPAPEHVAPAPIPGDSAGRT